MRVAADERAAHSQRSWALCKGSRRVC